MAGLHKLELLKQLEEVWHKYDFGNGSLLLPQSVHCPYGDGWVCG